MIIFLYEPKIKRNMVLYPVLFLIFVLAYVAMAWYDYFYDCRVLPLKRNKKSFTGLFKPDPHSKKQYIKNNRIILDKKSAEVQEDYRNKLIIYISHILVIVPIILYVAIYQNKVNKTVYPLIGILAVFTLLYHGASLITLSHRLR